MWPLFPPRKRTSPEELRLHTGLGNVASGPAEVLAFLNGAQISEGGYTIFGLPSRNLQGTANITTSIEGLKNRVDFREAVDYVVTEFGVANLKGLTLRERAQALIEIAHPDDRVELIAAAKRENILYRDQIYLAESARYFPSHINARHQFKSGIEIRFRPIRPSDEEEMRRLFYRFSDESVYYRYFSSLKAMPHTRMQTYVNVDWSDVMSIVGVVGKPGQGLLSPKRDTSWIQTVSGPKLHLSWTSPIRDIGISTYLFNLLVRLANERGIKGFWADVLFSNTAMMKVFYKSDLPVMKEMENGVYHVTIPFDPPKSPENYQ